MVNFTVTILITVGVLIFVCLGLYIGCKKYAKYLKKQYHAGNKTILFNGFDKYNKPKSQQSPPFNQLCKRGDIVVRDFRVNNNNNNINDNSNKSTLRIVSLNMEMGKQINKIISSLKTLNADIICLQEVDVSSSRCSYIDIIAELSKELNMNSLFTVEVVFDMKMNKKYSETDLLKDNDYNTHNYGYEGNAILSKYNFINTEGVVINCGRYDKYKHKYKTHTEAFVIIDVPNFGYIGCYSIHLDPHWCGVSGRIKQYNELLKHVSLNKDNVDYFILCGDFNTVCHGLNRLYPSIGCDSQSRYGHIGKTEAQYFQINAVQKGNDEYKLDLNDPFDKVNDYTMYALKGGYKTKADWCLLSSNFKVITKYVCPFKDRCSDHQWIMVEVINK